MINAVVTGNLTKDPEVKTLGTTSLVTFSLASQNPLQKGQERADATFVNCKLFGERGQTFLRFFKKGDSVLVSGELIERKWEAGDRSGKSLDMNCYSWSFMGPKEARLPDAVPTNRAEAKPVADPSSEIEDPFEI